MTPPERFEQPVPVLVLEVVQDVDEKKGVLHEPVLLAGLPAHLLGGGAPPLVHSRPAILDVHRLGLVDGRLRRVELLGRVDHGARLLELLPELLGARVLERGEWRQRLWPPQLVPGRDRRTRGAGHPGGPGSHEADATLAAFLPRHRAVRSRAAPAGEAD